MTVTYDYRSPVDGKTYISKATQELDAGKVAELPNPGAAVSVYASKHKAGLSKLFVLWPAINASFQEPENIALVSHAS